MAFADLSNEVIEAIFLHALDGPSYHTDRSTLLALAGVCARFFGVARRLLFARVVVATPEEGQRLLQTLTRDRDLAACVRSLTIRESAFGNQAVFSDLSQDDLLRICPNLSQLDSPVASWNELADGRAPLPAWPANLASLRFGRTLEFETDEEDSDPSETRQLWRVTRMRNAFEAYPTMLRSLKVSGIDSFESLYSGRARPHALKHLERLELDFVTASPETIDWLVGSGPLVELKIWMVTDPSSSSLEKILKTHANTLRSFTFKPVHRSQAAFLNDVLPLLTSLEHLTLGNHACDHTVWHKLPSSLTRLCIALPNNHANARLKLVADTIKDRLQSLERLELYSHVYFPPPIEVIYPPPSQSGLAIREVRLSHINTSREDLSQFFLQLAPGLYTLALHHAYLRLEAPWPQFSSLRRVEYGRESLLDDVDIFRLAGETVHSARIHFDSGCHLKALVEAIERRSSRSFPPLRSFELVGTFGVDVALDWTSGSLFDRLVSACAEAGTPLYINGRTVGTLGGMWKALQRPMEREEFV